VELEFSKHLVRTTRIPEEGLLLGDLPDLQDRACASERPESLKRGCYIRYIWAKVVSASLSERPESLKRGCCEIPRTLRYSRVLSERPESLKRGELICDFRFQLADCGLQIEGRAALHQRSSAEIHPRLTTGSAFRRVHLLPELQLDPVAIEDPGKFAISLVNLP